MTIEDFIIYSQHNINEIHSKLEESIKKNNINTSNKDLPFISGFYTAILQNITNENIKSTTGKLNIKGI